IAHAAHVSAVRSLYKRILLLHCFMPIDLWALEVTRFMVEWQNYKDTLQTQVLEAVGIKKLAFGADLSEEKLKDFQDEQIGHLYELMLESTTPNRQFDIQDEGIPK
uniref:Succinate dehydrogenase assembly factor 3 n=1 Tax=Sinocyclocheilus grahami TaxID=75366 RepID=A0A672R7L5_SINGR